MIVFLDRISGFLVAFALMLGAGLTSMSIDSGHFDCAPGLAADFAAGTCIMAAVAALKLILDGINGWR